MISRDELLKLRDNASQIRISRSVRKSLFKNKIWCPTSQRKVGIKRKKELRTSCNGTRCGLLNAHSINNKETSIYELICDHKLDCLILTETWWNKKSNASLGLIRPD